MSKDLITTNTDLQKSVASIEAFKIELDLIGTQCKLIKVTDDGTLSIAQQNLAKASQMAKFVDDKSSAIKAPYWEACKTIDSLRKSIPAILNEGITSLKEQIKQWELDKQKKVKEEQDVIDAKLAVEKEVLFRQPLTNEVVESIIDAQTLAAQQKELAAFSTTKTRGVRYNWRFELVDKTQLPQEWITVDESAVKEYMKDKKDGLKNGEIINGIKFYKDIIITA